MFNQRSLWIGTLGWGVGSLGFCGLAALSPAAIAAESADAALKISEVVPQTTCKLALVAQASDPIAYGKDKMVGRVYNVTGSTVYLEMEDGKTEVLTLTPWEKGKLGNIIGRRIVVTPYYCNRANLDTTLKWKPGQAIPVPPLNFSTAAPSIPPVTPRPVAPAPMPERAQPDDAIIPQTW